MIAESLLAFLCAVAFVAVFYGPWQSLCTDIARQIVFEQRDKLFDMARAGRLTFSSGEYREIRIGLENIIRFSHDLTLPMAVYLAILFPRVRQTDIADTINSAIKRLHDDQLERDVTRLVATAYASVIIMMICKSAIGLILFPLVFIVGIWAYTVRSIVSRSKPYVLKIGRLIQAESECT